ncbi:hypothetical protein HPB50_019031 [Hyalomma asiaticum]|uniref:Uncharacterized protein n=1 Tax=Hyalomma asiaticum TaxID=266040 RepID=A0ACB7TM84_HYAAI|nr:hypothetical protein HPB50_019031 [Hyalomma asiaticum]
MPEREEIDRSHPPAASPQPQNRRQRTAPTQHEFRQHGTLPPRHNITATPGPRASYQRGPAACAACILTSRLQPPERVHLDKPRKKRVPPDRRSRGPTRQPGHNAEGGRDQGLAKGLLQVATNNRSRGAHKGATRTTGLPKPAATTAPAAASEPGATTATTARTASATAAGATAEAATTVPAVATKAVAMQVGLPATPTTEPTEAQEDMAWDTSCLLLADEIRVRTFATVAARTPVRAESSGVPAQSEAAVPTKQVSEKGGERGESELAEAASSPAAEVVPASPANEAAVTATPAEPEQMELAGPLDEKAAKRRRKKGGKQMRRKRAQAEAMKAASDSDSDSDSSDNSEPETKRTAVTESDGDSSSSTLIGSSAEGERQRPCPMCGFSDDVCECSVLSDATYSSTNENSLIEESSSVEGKERGGGTVLRELVDELGLVDAWRAIRPGQSGMTWTGRGLQSRIDRFYVSPALAPSMHSSWLCSAALSDHRLVVLHFADSNLIAQGKRPWRLSARLLKDREIFEDVGKFLARSLRGRDDLTGSEWDEVKAGVTECFREWGKRRAREERAEIQVVSDAILLLSMPLSCGPGITAALTSLRKQLRTLLQRRWDG